MGWNRVMPEVMRSFFADFRAWPRGVEHTTCWEFGVRLAAQHPFYST